ncbi:MAG: NAD(P)/FAD-dependent oxidoreductase [Woeseiaceae bacterium]|nr:NAD(P)/FAD-dependent oxidoreductase [Woeseiaceae bacterium]
MNLDATAGEADTISTLHAQMTNSGAGSDDGIVIVGGGIMGMYLAYKLRQEGKSVTILESSASSGGLACPDHIGDYVWDRFYHVILMSDLNTRGLIEDLGLADKLQWGTTRTGFYVDGRFYSMSDSIEFLRFPPLSLIDKLRLGATIFFAARIRNWRRLEKVLAVDWLTRWSGKSVVEKIWLPLLRSKLGDNATRASAAFIWTTIARMYAARRSGIKREMFGYVDGGYDAVLTAMQQRLDELGVETIVNARVERVIDSGAGVTVHYNGSESRKFGNAVLTVPTPIVTRLCEQLTPDEVARLNGVTYQGIACASVLLRKPLGPYYVTNITDRVPFTGVIEMTALVDRANFGGNALVYLPRYLTQQDEFWNKTDDEIEELFVSTLDRMYPEFEREDVLSFNVSRARNVLAVSTLEYSDTWLPPVRTSMPHVFTVNSAQIASGTLNVNETLGIVDSKFAELTEALRENSIRLAGTQE